MIWARLKGTGRALHIFAAIVFLFGGLGSPVRASSPALSLPLEVLQLRPVLGEAFDAYLASFCDGQHSIPSDDGRKDGSGGHSGCWYCQAVHGAALAFPPLTQERLERRSFTLHFPPEALNFQTRPVETGSRPRAPPAS